MNISNKTSLVFLNVKTRIGLTEKKPVTLHANDVDNFLNGV